MSYVPHHIRRLTGDYPKELSWLVHRFGGVGAGELVTGVATPLHLGSTTQVWDAAVTNQTTGRRMTAYRCTQLILYPRPA